MCKYHYGRGMLIGVTLLSLQYLAACDADENHISDPAPVLLTVEELALSQEDFVGKLVILEGRLGTKTDYTYFIAASDSNRLSVSLRFKSNNVNTKEMRRCLGAVALVTGVLEESRSMIVDRVKLKSETLTHKPGDCYHYYQREPVTE